MNTVIKTTAIIKSVEPTRLDKHETCLHNTSLDYLSSNEVAVYNTRALSLAGVCLEGQILAPDCTMLRKSSTKLPTQAGTPGSANPKAQPPG